MMMRSRDRSEPLICVRYRKIQRILLKASTLYHTLPRFFKVLFKTSGRISINTAGKSAFKVVTFPNLKEIRPKQAKTYCSKMATFAVVCLLGSTNWTPTTQTSFKFCDFGQPK